MDSIEHGHNADKKTIELIKAKGAWLVPTVGTVDALVAEYKDVQMTDDRRKRMDAYVQGTYDEITTAMSLGVKIASGFDASTVDRQGHNADELAALVKRGMPPADAIRAATVNAAELLGWTADVGAAERVNMRT